MMLASSNDVWVLINPYLVAVFIAALGILGWFGRTILKRLSDLADVTNALTVDVAVLKDRQKLTAAKVGVPAKSLQDTEPGA